VPFHSAYLEEIMDWVWVVPLLVDGTLMNGEDIQHQFLGCRSVCWTNSPANSSKSCHEYIFFINSLYAFLCQDLSHCSGWTSLFELCKSEHPTTIALILSKQLICYECRHA
jgi:hypothetical protein